ncbi:MAG: hypothetical protein WDN03_09985 [Rhizomicrobium sp.]
MSKGRALRRFTTPAAPPFDLVGGRRLADGELREQLRREHVQVDFAVVVALVGGAGGGDGDRRIVQRDLREIRAKAADRDVDAFAVDFTADGHAGDAVEGFGDVGVGEFADVLGEDAVGEVGGGALGVGRGGQAGAVAGDDDGFDPVVRVSIGGVGRCGRDDAGGQGSAQQ